MQSAVCILQDTMSEALRGDIQLLLKGTCKAGLTGYNKKTRFVSRLYIFTFLHLYIFTSCHPALITFLAESAPVNKEMFWSLNITETCDRT